MTYLCSLEFQIVRTKERSEQRAVLKWKRIYEQQTINARKCNSSFLMVCGIAIAQNGQVKGVINGRGATMSVLSQGGESITVV